MGNTSARDQAARAPAARRGGGSTAPAGAGRDPARTRTETADDPPETAAAPARRSRVLGRVVDVLLSGLGLILTAPAWVVLPALIKLEDGGPVFFTQERVGKGGELFTSWKFRSMRPRGDRDAPPAQAESERERVTRVGAFMRPCALDELPQLVNVLRGDMSLVGPRPLLPEEVEHRTDGREALRLEELPGYEERHSVRPGLTGFAQTHAPRDLPHEEKFRYDLRYVRNAGLWTDLKLIVKSVAISLTARWPEIEREEPEALSSSP